MEKIRIRIRNREYILNTDEEKGRLFRIADSLEKKIDDFCLNVSGMSEVDALTLVAFDLSEQADSSSVDIELLKEALKESKDKNEEILLENMNSAESELFQMASVKERENNELRTQLAYLEKYADELSKKKSDNPPCKDDEVISLIDSLDFKESEIAKLKATITERDEGIKSLEESERARIKEVEMLLKTIKAKDDEINKLKESKNEKLQNLESSDEKSELIEGKNKEINELQELFELQDEENKKLKKTLDDFEKAFGELSKTKEEEIKNLQKENEELKLKITEPLPIQ